MAAEKDPSLADDVDPRESGLDIDLDLPPEPLAPRVSAKPSAAPVTSQIPSGETHQHTRGNVRRAKRLGASPEQIAATLPDDLDDWIDAETEARAREELRMEREQMMRRYEQQSRQQPASPAAPPAEEDYSIDNTEVEGLATTHPTIAKAIKKLPELMKENAALKKRLDARDQSEGQHRQQEVIDALDDGFEALEDAESYGEGSGMTLDAKSETLARREALIRAAGIDLNKDSTKTIARKLKAAHKLLGRAKAEPKKLLGAYGREVDDAEPEPEPARGLRPNGNGKRFTREDFAAAQTATPTNRGRKQTKSKESAYAAVAKAMRDQGVADDDFREEDGIPE